MTQRHNALGRGLDALIPSAPPAADGRSDPTNGTGLEQIPVDAIDPNPEQPRRLFDPDHLEQLADSLRRHGVLQPVVVRRAGDRYELIVGERRWRAARRAGLATLPAVISDVAPSERLELALVENVQRRDLNPIELAHAYQALVEVGFGQEEIGQRVGLDRSSVSNHMRLLDLARDIQEDVEIGRISMGHAKALLQVPSPERRRQLRDQIVSGNLTVREAERRAREASGGPTTRRRGRPPRQPSDPNLIRLLDDLREHLQTRVRIQGDTQRGRIEVEYFGAEDLHRIAQLLLGAVAEHGTR